MVRKQKTDSALLQRLALGAVFCILLGCATDPPTAAHATTVTGSCNPADAWVAGRTGQEAAKKCATVENRRWREAYNLGRELNTFELRLQSLDQELAATMAANDAATRIGQLKLQRIKLAREIESISGVAAVRGWDEQIQVKPYE